MIWGYPYFWNHPNGVFSAKVLLATFGLAMEFFTVSEFPFSWEVYQIWEQEGARLGWWRISILKNAGWFLIRCWPLFPCFYCAKKLYKSPCQVWKICDVWNGIVIQHFCDIWKMFCMYIYRWLYMTHDYIYICIYLMISPKCEAAENSSNLSERFFGAQTLGHCGAVLGLPCGW